MLTTVLLCLLAAAWLVVLVPMASKYREQVRRPTEAAMTTRILHRGGQPRAARRQSDSLHPFDPHWEPEWERGRGIVIDAEAEDLSASVASTRLAAAREEEERLLAASQAESEREEIDEARRAADLRQARAVARAAALPRRAIGAKFHGAPAEHVSVFDRPREARMDEDHIRQDLDDRDLDDRDPDDEVARRDDYYCGDRLVDEGEASHEGEASEGSGPVEGRSPVGSGEHASGEAAGSEPVTSPRNAREARQLTPRPAGNPRQRRRVGFDPEADAIAAQAKYVFRQRVATTLMGLVLGTAVLAAVIAPALWLAAGLSLAALGAYLGYLRIQVRHEHEIRNRRLARLRRVSAGEDSDLEPAGTRPARLAATRPRSREAAAAEDPSEDFPEDADGSAAEDGPGPRGVQDADIVGADIAVLELDDEDPSFEHLDPYVAEVPSGTVTPEELRQASGQ